jgi:hypothetical protein
VQKFNQINPNSSDFSSPGTAFEIGKYYRVDNNFSSLHNYGVEVSEISDFQS